MPDENRFQRLFEVTAELTACNQFKVIPIDQWPLDTGYDLAKLNEEALRLPVGQISTFVDGETSDVNELSTQFKLEYLSEFLNDVFDGDLHLTLSVPP